MPIQTAYYTDVGIQKQTNEDALVIRTADTAAGPLVMAAVCDGMGGLNRGELASSTMVRALSDWFELRLPVLLSDGYDIVTLRSGVEFEIRRQSKLLEDYARRSGIRMGTTLAMLILWGQRGVTVNVGDSRVYELEGGQIRRLTHDQSLVQREIDEGNLRPEDEEKDSRRNVLLQCVGDTASLAPELREFTIQPGAAYLLCSDGFRHELTEQEIEAEICQALPKGRAGAAKALERLAQRAIARGETDNITAAAVWSA